MKRILMAVAALALTAGASVASVAPAHAATTLGGVSVWNACVYQNGTPSSLTIQPYNVMGWKCVYNGGWNSIQLGVDLNKECRREYGSAAYASYTNWNDPYSWRCYR
jgi:hypothetical protein